MSERAAARAGASSSSATGRTSPGGSESLARALAERLSADYAVTVFTTCARDYVTWRNELPPGERRRTACAVRRFPVEEERDLAAFNRFCETLYDRPHTDEDERDLAAPAGSLRAARWCEALRAQQDRFRGRPVLHLPLLPDLSRACGPRRSARSSCRPPTTSRRCASASTTSVFARPRALRVPDRGRGGARALPLRRSATGPRSWRAWAWRCPPPPDVEGFRAATAWHGRYVALRGPHRRGQGLRGDARASTSATAASAGSRRALVLIGKLAMPEPRGARRALPRLPRPRRRRPRRWPGPGRDLPQPLREPLHRAARGLRARRRPRCRLMNSLEPCRPNENFLQRCPARYAPQAQWQRPPT